MAPLRTTLSFLLLAGAAGLSAASLVGDPGPRTREVVVDPGTPRTDETWVVENLFDGQTAVPLDHEIVLTVGIRDFRDGEAPTGDVGWLLEVETGDPVHHHVFMEQDRTRIVVQGGLAPNTDYELDLSSLRSRLYSIRELPPGPIAFSTAHAPQVTGLWRNEDTLIVAFSEPMDPVSLTLGLEGVNVLWKEDGELRSLAGDLNLAAFAWQADSHLFLLASIAFTDELGFVWVQVSSRVRGASGALLDGDQDGRPGAPDDDYFEEVWPASLPACYARDDIPAPCVTLDEVPNLFPSW